MADVGTSSSNMTQTLSPNADAMGVDPSLDSLAAYIVQGQTAWQTHDGATLNNLLQGFWSAAAGWNSSALQNQSYGTLLGQTIQADITALDGYSHRLLGFEYMFQMASAAPADILLARPGSSSKSWRKLVAPIARWCASSAAHAGVLEMSTTSLIGAPRLGGRCRVYPKGPVAHRTGRRVGHTRRDAALGRPRGTRNE